MATFQKYKRKDGTTGWTAIVRVTGFDPARQAFTKREDAETWASTTERDLKERRERGGARPEMTTVTVRQLIERYLADPKVRQLRSYDDLEALLATCVDRLGDARARTFGRLQITQFRDELMKERPRNRGKLGAGTLSPARVNRYLSALRACWHWAIEEQYVREPWPAKIMLDEPDAKLVTATPAELQLLFAACDADAPELGTLARFLAGTGARLGDAMNVTWRDVNIEGQEVTLGGAKTGKPYRVAMLPPAVEACKRAAKVKHLSGRVLWQWRDTEHPRKAWDRARKNFPGHLAGIRMHDLRHICASLLAAAGASTVQLAAQLNHSSLEMVKRYSHLQPAHRSAAHDAVDELFGVKKAKGRGARK
ncbi:MAG: tyrosine-type recombinase/integrase [Bryobacteraceae bacterium]|nr:tyrosine-type recombinase/integrase [Bryobacteraceae bacterium]